MNKEVFFTRMNKHCKDAFITQKQGVTVLLSLLLFFSIFLFVGTNQTYAYEYESDLFSVSFSELKCGTPITFSVNVTNPDPTSTYTYYLNYVDGYVDGVKEYIFDPSRLPGYQSSNQFSYTFYASGKYEARFYVLEKLENGTAQFYHRTIEFTINDPNYPTIETVADNIVAQCLAAGCTTDYEKALWLHDYIVDNSVYDNTYVHCGAEGALVRGLGICEAFHRGYTMLLKRVGIEYGRIENRNKLYHVWTAVKLDGDWYQVDVTWDNKNANSGLTPYENHLYFAVNTDIMDGRSSPNTLVGEGGGFSTALKDNYFIQSGHVHEYSDVYRPIIQSHLDSRETSFTIPVTNGFRDDYYYNTNNVLFYPAAFQLSNETWTTSDGCSANVSVTYSALLFTVSVEYAQEAVSYDLKLTPPSGYTNNEIYIDGACYTAVSDGSDLKIVLENTCSKTAVMYKCNANNIPIGMYVWTLNWDGYKWSVTPVPELDDLISYHGFSIRYTGNNGIRFKSGISSQTKTLLKTTGVNGYKLSEMGTIYMSNANRSLYPFVMGGTKVSEPGKAYWTENGKLNDKVCETVGGRERFANALTKLKTSVYDVDIAFRAYAILKKDDGDQIIIYGPIVAKSIYSIAKQLIVRGDFAVGSDGYNYISNIIKTVEE